MQELRQSTEVKVRVGCFVDVSDGFTPQTDITLGGDAAELLKHNGVATVDISAATWAAVTGAPGWYDLTLTAGYTDTLGQLTVVVQDNSDCLPVHRDFLVVTQNFWDSKYSTDKLQVDAVEVSGDSTAADDLELFIEALGTDDKVLVSTDAQDLSGTLDVNTKTITAGIIANATFNADVGSTAYATNIIALAGRKVLDELNLDHLMKVAVADRDTLAEVVDDTVLANIMTKTDGDTSDFDHATQSLEAIASDTAATLADTGTDGVVLKAAGLNADAVAEIWAAAMTDIAAGAPSATCSALVALNYLYEMARNKIEVTASEIAVYKDDASTKLMESDISDDATTFTRGEFGAAD